jgi:hypothetical protein
MAFELIESQTGPGLKPLHHGVTPTGSPGAFKSEFYEVLHNARGAVGDRKWSNAHALRDAMMAAWTEDGEALRELWTLLNASFP